jgi:TonB family protein
MHMRVIKQWLYKSGQLISEKDSNQLNKERDHYLDSVKQSSTVKDVEIESTFAGGHYAWQQYLLRSFQYPDRARDHEVQGMVIIEFIVSKEGAVEDAIIANSVENSLDKEALKIMVNCPAGYRQFKMEET